MPKGHDSLQRALNRADEICQRLFRLRTNLPVESGTLVAELSESLTELRQSMGDPDGSLYQARVASLATRMACHFFIERSMPRFCERVLDELVAEVGAGSGAIVLFSDDARAARIVAARDSLKQSLEAGSLRVSRSILSRIQDGEDSVLIQDACSDAGLAHEDSVQELQLRSVLAVALRFQDYLAGAIYLENETSTGAFSGLDLKLLLEVGRIIAIYLNSAFRLTEEIAARRRIYVEVKGKTYYDGIVGCSASLIDVLETVSQVGPSDVTVLIEGESGTGKELIARAIHLAGRRADKPMVVVNCAAIPENLLESELFGHEKGAFTGAFESKRGRFEDAHGSTLFLDEIAEMPLGLQAKLLRFLQSGELRRVGGSRTIKVDARLVAATNRDLQELIEKEQFRKDLFFRLCVVPVKVPPLRERAEDITLLVDHFVRSYALQMDRRPPEVDPDVYEILQQYSWPGNVRELENLVQRLIVLCRGKRIRAEDIPEHIYPRSRGTVQTQKNPFNRFLVNVPANYEELKKRRSEMHRLASVYAQRLENRFIDLILRRTGGNISRAAEQAGIHRTLIHRNLRTRSHPRDS